MAGRTAADSGSRGGGVARTGRTERRVGWMARRSRTAAAPTSGIEAGRSLDPRRSDVADPSRDPTRPWCPHRWAFLPPVVRNVAREEPAGGRVEATAAVNGRRRFRSRAVAPDVAPPRRPGAFAGRVRRPSQRAKGRQEPAWEGAGRPSAESRGAAGGSGHRGGPGGRRMGRDAAAADACRWARPGAPLVFSFVYTNSNATSHSGRSEPAEAADAYGRVDIQQFRARIYN